MLSGCGATRKPPGRCRAGRARVRSRCWCQFPRTTAAQIEDLKAGLPVADLRAAGWVVEGPSPARRAALWSAPTTVFPTLSQVPALVADVAGNGTESQRPFRLSVSEQPSFLQDHYVASGMSTCGAPCPASTTPDWPRMSATRSACRRPRCADSSGSDPAKEHRFSGRGPAAGQGDVFECGRAFQWRPGLGARARQRDVPSRFQQEGRPGEGPGSVRSGQCGRPGGPYDGCLSPVAPPTPAEEPVVVPLGASQPAPSANYLAVAGPGPRGPGTGTGVLVTGCN